LCIIEIKTKDAGKLIYGLTLDIYGLFYDFTSYLNMQRKKEGFQGQKAVVIPRKIISDQCAAHPLISNLYVTDIGYYPRAQYHYRERLQGIDQYIFIYCIEGNGTVSIQENTYAIEAGEFFIVPANVAHSYMADADHPWTIYWIHFKGQSARTITDLFQHRYNGYKGFKHYNDQTVQLFNEIYEHLERGYSMDHLVYSNMCLQHFLGLFLYPQSDKYTATLGQHNTAIDFMNKHLDRMLTVEEMAGSVNLSPSHFTYIFKTKTGFTPIEYFNHLKVQKACQYLLFTDLRIKEIAYELGIEDQGYFSRLFTKVMGISPNEYRERRSG
jgi:AraC-like DNA-binding protein